MTELVDNAKENREKPTYWRHALAILATPILLYAFVRLEEIAKGTEQIYWGNVFLPKLFVEIMFAAFIPLAFGTIFLLYSQIDKAPSKWKYVSYSIAILALISTISVALSLATVPRGGYYSDYGFSADTFVGNLTRTHDKYEFESNQIVFTRDYPISMARASGDYLSLVDGMEIRIQTSATNLSGPLYFYLELYHLTGPTHVSKAVFFSYNEASVDLEESQLWTGNIGSPWVIWGDHEEDRRMRLEGYRFVCQVRLRLEGPNQGSEIPVEVDISGKFDLLDFRVDSALQNGSATFACGFFAAIHALILVVPVINRKARR